MTMERFVFALKLFLKILIDNSIYDRAAQAFPQILPRKATPRPAQPAPTTPAPRTAAQTAPAAPASTRSDALTLLSVLQREARLIDFLKEEIAGYADAQIGAAVRDVHRDAAAALDRLFALKPLRRDCTVTPAGLLARA